jgi:hypothetical protein
MKNRNRLRRLGNKVSQLSPELQKAAKGLSLPGEAGRALPDAVRAQSHSTPIQAEIPTATGRTEIFTYTTRALNESSLLYQAESWVRMRLILENAGAVDVSTRENITPVGSGKGITLPTDVEVQFNLNKKDRIYIASTSVNRVRVIIEPIAWGDQIATMLGKLVGLSK